MSGEIRSGALEPRVKRKALTESTSPPGRRVGVAAAYVQVAPTGVAKGRRGRLRAASKHPGHLEQLGWLVLFRTSNTTMKNILISLLMWPVGTLVGAMTISQMVIIFRFAIPSCVKSLATGDMVSKAPLIRYRWSLAVTSVMLVAALAAVLTWTGSAAKIGFFTGLILVALRSLSATSPKHARANMTEFLNSNRPHLKPEFVARAEDWLLSEESHPSSL